MTRNIITIDRIVRPLLAVTVAILYISHRITGFGAIIFGIVLLYPLQFYGILGYLRHRERRKAPLNQDSDAK